MVGIAVSDEQQVERARESAHERVFVAPEHLRSAIEDAARDEGWMAAADVFLKRSRFCAAPMRVAALG